MKYVQEQTKSIGDICEELNIPKSTIHQWISQYRQFDQEAIHHPEKMRQIEQTLKDAEAENRRKEREIEDLKEELAILKRRCTSSAKKRTKVPVHRRSPLGFSIGEDVQGPKGIPERVLQMACGRAAGTPRAKRS